MYRYDCGEDHNHTLLKGALIEIVAQLDKGCTE